MVQIWPGRFVIWQFFLCVCHKIMKLLITWQAQPWRRHRGWKSKAEKFRQFALFLCRVKCWSCDMPHPDKGNAVESRKPERKLFLNMWQVRSWPLHKRSTIGTQKCSYLAFIVIFVITFRSTKSCFHHSYSELSAIRYLQHIRKQTSFPAFDFQQRCLDQGEACHMINI